jgi:apolipoprotein N-acyltransferase
MTDDKHGARKAFRTIAGGFLASAILAAAGFAPQLWGITIWVALVPALVVSRRAPLGTLWWVAWAAGYVNCLALYYWVMIVTPVGGLLLPIYLGLYWPVFFVGVEVLARRLSVPRLAAMVVLWPVLEWVRGMLMTGLPWFFLGHALYRWPRLIQSADIGGALLVSTIIVAFNALIAGAVTSRRRRAAFVAAAVCLVAADFAYGIWRMESVTVLPGPTVGLVQPNVPQSIKINQSEKESAQLFLKLRRYTMEAKEQGAEVIFWPETIMPGIIGTDDYTVVNGMEPTEPGDEPTEILDELELQGVLPHEKRTEVTALTGGGLNLADALVKVCGQETNARLTTYGLLAATAKISGRPLIAGVICGVFDDDGHVTRTYNRACQFDAEGREVTHYDKVHLVPFGEFIPFRDSIPPVGRLIAKMMPIEPMVYPGPDFAVLGVGPHKYGPAICFEDTFSYISRAYRRKGADVLVNLTNDGWFGGSFELEAHLGNAVFRAVETRMAVIRAANTGISAVISPRGEVTARLTGAAGRDREVEGILVAPVELSRNGTIYLATGDYWLWAAVVLAGAYWLATRGVKGEKTTPFCA